MRDACAHSSTNLHKRTSSRDITEQKKKAQRADPCTQHSRKPTMNKAKPTRKEHKSLVYTFKNKNKKLSRVDVQPMRQRLRVEIVPRVLVVRVRPGCPLRAAGTNASRRPRARCRGGRRGRRGSRRPRRPAILAGDERVRVDPAEQPAALEDGQRREDAGGVPLCLRRSGLTMVVLSTSCVCVCVCKRKGVQMHFT